MLSIFFNIDRDKPNTVWRKLKKYYRKFKAVPVLK